MSELAGFAGRALRMILAGDGLKKALDEQQTLARKMSHRVKNLFSIIESMIRMSARTSRTKDEVVEGLSARGHALAAANALVRRNFSDAAQDDKVDLSRPYLPNAGGR